MSAGGTLEVVNLGDSGLKLVRGGKVAWSSRAQEHVWNCPYQLSHPAIVPQTDTPADAAVTTLQLQAGDVIVVGTDGLWDNMWDEQLIEVLGEAGHGKGPGQQQGRDDQGKAARRAARALAQKLVDAANRNAVDHWYKGPWALELEQHGKVGGAGGSGGGQGGGAQHTGG